MTSIPSYLSFLLKSTNHHGIHSPFIYRYLTECLYKKPRKHRRTSLDILFKSIAYFEVNTLYLPVDDTYIKKILRRHFDRLSYHQTPYDLLFLQEPDAGVLNMSGADQVYHNDTLCIIDHIHTSRSARQRWEEVKLLSQARITIDCYHCGLVFFRKEQARQHFTIRI